MKLSNTVKAIMSQKGLDNTQCASILGISYNGFANKLSKDCFSLDDLIAICNACSLKINVQGLGFSITLNP